MQLDKLIERCSEILQEEVNGDWGYEDMDDVSVKFSTHDGTIGMFYYKDKKTRKWVCEVTIEHDKNDHLSSNLESYLSDALEECVDWEVAREEWRESNMDEYQWNGFDSEADFWRWKEGR